MEFSELPQDLLEIYLSKEEYSGKLDSCGRFLHRFSKNKDVWKPVVSEHLISHNLLDIEWPENRRFAACLTHDVDTIHPSLKYSLYTASKYGSQLRFRESWRRIVSNVQKTNSENPYWNFKAISELERRYNAKSSFYFKATSTDPMGWVYAINDLSDEIKYLDEIKFEVGLHGGYYSYNSPEELKKEKKNLEKILGRKVIGIRNHFLRFSIPSTWRILSGLGFKYDTTFGYSDMPGFRNGMCHPFRPYDLELMKEIEIVELPLVIMDSTLFKMPINIAWKTICDLIEVTEKNKGVITILWHNNTFDKIFNGSWATLYEKILRFLKEKNAWMTSGEEVLNHWTENVDLSKSKKLILSGISEGNGTWSK
jgi:peptidoglycan/xylan/chitin deacetylase (PgdA/CDA1 family)